MPWGFLKDLISQSGLELYLAFVFFLIIKLYPSLKEYHEDRKTLKKEDFDILSDVLSNEGKRENTFLVEQAFERKYGKPISYREISYLLNVVSPSEALSQYMASRNFLSFKITEERPSFNTLFKSKRYRSCRKLWNIVWYFIFAFLGLSLIPGSIWVLGEKGPYWFIATVIFLFYSLGTAYLCLQGLGAISNSERLIEMVEYSEKHIKGTKNRWYY